MATTLDVLRVFVDDAGRHGNPLGVFLDGPAIPADRRQAVAADLGFSETVFVDDRARGVVAIFTPAAELPLAGHPLVGTAWLLADEGTPVDVLRPPAGDVPTFADREGRRWIRADPEWAPAFDHPQHAAAADVDALAVPPGDDEHAQHWAFEDEAAGRVRARVFVSAMGIPEDEATGAAALRLGARLGRPLTIRQGHGSIIAVRPGPAHAGRGTVEIGGRVARAERREHASPSGAR